MKIKKLLMLTLCLCMLALIVPVITVSAEDQFPFTEPAVWMLLPSNQIVTMTEESSGIWTATVQTTGNDSTLQFKIKDTPSQKCYTTKDAIAFGTQVSLLADDFHPESITIPLERDKSYKLTFTLDTRSHDSNAGNGAKLTVTAQTVTYCKVNVSADGPGNAYGTGTYEKGASVTVEAQTGGYGTFLGWRENGTIVSRDAKYTFTATGDRALEAVFIEKVGVSTNNNNYYVMENVPVHLTIPSGHPNGMFTLYVNHTECKNAAGVPYSVACTGQTTANLTVLAADLLKTSGGDPLCNLDIRFTPEDTNLSGYESASVGLMIHKINSENIYKYLQHEDPVTVAYDGTVKHVNITSKYEPGSTLYLAPEQFVVKYEANGVGTTEDPITPAIYQVRISLAQPHLCYEINNAYVGRLIIEASAPFAAVDAKTGERVAADFTVYSRHGWENNDSSMASVTTTTGGNHAKITDLQPGTSYVAVLESNENYTHSSGLGYFILNQDGTASPENDTDNMLTMENGVLTAKLNKRNPITKKAAVNGTYLVTDAPGITTELGKAAVGTKVYLTAKPEILAKLRSFTVTAKSGAQVEVTMTGENTGYFIMPDEPVTVETLFYIWHTHDWEYTVEGKTIKAQCADSECPIPDGGSVTISASDAAYDGTAKAASLSADSIGDIENLTIAYEGLSSAPVNAGNYTASLTVDGKTVSVTYTISPRAITVTANDQAITYGGSLTENTVTVTGDGLAATDTLASVTLTPSTTNATDNGTVTPGGAVIKAGGKDVTGNYTITYKPGKLTVSKAVTTIAFNGYAPGKTYDAKALAVPTAEQLALTGAVYSDVAFTWYKDSVAEENKLTSAPVDAGTYYVVASIADTANTVASSTTSDAIVIQKLDISPAVITEYKPLFYNGEEQTNVITGVKVGNVVVDDYTVTGNTGKDADVYTMTLTGQENFTGTAARLWAIGRKFVTVTAEDKVVAVGAAMPELTYTVEGLIGEDTLTTQPVLDCVADMNTVGEYEITVTGGDAGGNYAISTVSGKLSVRQKHSVTVEAAANGTVTASHTEAVEGTEVTVTTAPASGYRVASLKVTKADGGVCAVTAGTDGSYTFTMPGEAVTVKAAFEKIPASSGTAGQTPGSPNTGDGAAPALWSTLALCSLLCGVVLIFGKKYCVK